MLIYLALMQINHEPSEASTYHIISFLEPSIQKQQQQQHAIQYEYSYTTAEPTHTPTN